MKHEDTPGERHHGPHDVLDQQDGKPCLTIELTQGRNDHVDFHRPQARHHFIEQEQLRVGGKRTRKLQPLPIRQRQRGSRLIALDV